ncbi:fasciclin domain-containing protein [Halochromatium glycolicum]|nr:fasciclin domain-containing protein [Halochromatium glycolicum]
MLYKNMNKTSGQANATRLQSLQLTLLGESQMTLRKTTLTVGVVLALGLSVGTAEQAAAGSHCGNMAAGYQGHPHGRMLTESSGYDHYNGMPMRRPIVAHPAMYWGTQQPSLVKTSTAEAAGDAPGDIVDVAVGAGSFGTLAAALEAADLVDTLKGEGPFTVFAPTDDAFAKIPQDQLNALLADKAKLTAVLTYHVVPGKVMAADVAALNSATTVQGGNLSIDTTDGVKVNDATVVTTDVEASNGIIHVIDTVLMPE